MINVFTNDLYKTCFSKANIIMDVDLWFTKKLSIILKEFNEEDKNFIRNIDHSEINYVNGRLFIVSDDGVTTINHISTGCKACILSNHIENKLINITLCGENAIRALFTHATNKGSRNSFLLTHNRFSPVKGLYKFNINNVKQGDLYDLWLTIAEGACSNV